MTSHEAGTPADSPDVAIDKEITPADITQPDGKRQEPDAAPQQELSDQDDFATPDEQHESTTRRLSRKVREVGAAIPRQPKHRWAALGATVTATAGLIAGWIIRRGHRPRTSRWPRRGR